MSVWKQDDDGWFYREWRPFEPKLEPFELGLKTNDGFMTSEHVFVRSLALGHEFDEKMKAFVNNILKKDKGANDA